MNGMSAQECRDSLEMCWINILCGVPEVMRVPCWETVWLENFQR